ncbi:MAG TPA: hypothetical protein VFN80_09895 [Acidothermaceae bacterium]|nr:hypothetical protein [Acidothermaceae bacterium]
MDDEVRATLHDRANLIAPPLDVFDRVESRAKRMHRNRVAASVTGAVAAVAAVAIVVPTVVTGSGDHDVATTTTATQQRTEEPTQSAQGKYALDPAKPWPYRGDQKAIAPTTLAKFRHDWSAKHPGSILQPLWGDIYEPSQQAEVVFVAKVDDSARWGMVMAAPDGSQFVVDAPLAPDTAVLPIVAPGDEVARLLAVSAPEVKAIQYAGDGVTFKDMFSLAPGVAVTPLEGNQSIDQIRVIGADGQTAYQGAVPDSSIGATPANLLKWPTRGTVPNGLPQEATTAYAKSRQQTAAVVQTNVLYGGVDAAGTQYLLAQAWISGDQAASTVGYLKHVDGTVELQLKAQTAADAVLVVLDVTDSPATPTETLVVVPQPTTGQVLYASSAGAKFVPAPADQYGVFTVARDPMARNDRLQVLDGDGKQTFEGAVASQLCGVSGCG